MERTADPAPAPLAFVDTETTGTNPFFHDLWEIAVIVDDEELVWRVEPDLRKADPTALSISKYYSRDHTPVGTKADVARAVATALSGRHMVGMVPSFDATFLDRFLRNNGHSPAWHYHLVDVEAMIAGRFGLTPPWNSSDLTRALGVEPDDFDRHTALGDAQWAKAAFETLLALPKAPAHTPELSPALAAQAS